MKTKTTILALFTLLLGAQVQAQQGESINYIRDTARFTTTGTFGSDNAIDVFATEEGSFVTGIPFAEFAALLDDAWGEGRGGIIDFDNPVYGPAYTGYDRTAVRAFIERRVEDAINAGVNFDLQTDLQAFIEEARAEAVAAGLVDFSARVPVVNRNDMGKDDTDLNPVSETIDFNRIIAVFGEANDRQLVIERGPQFYTEGDLATFEDPAAEYLQFLKNDTHFMGVRRPGYGNPVPISLPFALNCGMADLDFDPRDNVTAVGFTMLSANNFQYWQGLAAEPDRPNNMRVVAEFSDGTSEELTATTRQSSGGWDIFFAIKAPEGTSIDRIWVRVVGRNWRTFTFMDDLGFVTEPSAPYVASALTASGSVGAPFYYLLLTGQGPESVSIAGLPDGLSFDARTGLISGSPSTEGTFSATVTMTNAVGTSEETLEFTILPSAGADAYPVISNADELSGAVTLKRELNPIQVATSLDEEVLPGELEFFTIVHRINQDGSETLSTLDATGLGMADGLFTGTPLRPDQVGNYEVQVFVKNEFGGDKATFSLSVFPIVPAPNFDGDNATDILWRDLGGKGISVLESSKLLADPQAGNPLGKYARNTGLEGDHALFGDLDANNQADLFAYQEGMGQVDLLYFLPEEATRSRSIAELSTGWMPAMAGDLRGDGFVSYLWKQEATRRWAIWHVAGDDLAWAGIFLDDGIPRDLALHADFTGNGIRDLLFRHEANLYELVEVGTLTGNGDVLFESEVFTPPSADWVPHLAADFNGDSKDDLLWKNTRTGDFSIWVMDGTSVPANVRVATEGEEEEAADFPIGTVMPAPLFAMSPALEVAVALDVNEDLRDDLVLIDQERLGLYLLRMDEGLPVGAPVQLAPAGSPFLPVAAGDYNADKREDVLLQDIDAGTVMVAHLGPDGLAGERVLGTASPGGLAFEADRIVSADLTPPAEPLCTSLGGLWFSRAGLGDYHDSLRGWIFHESQGFLAPIAPEAGEYHDPVMGFLWISPEDTSLIYHRGRNNWLYYIEGTSEPRMFYNFNRRREMREDQLRG
ncbi:MAG: putative Ig domain-containing protein [Oceanipulchritudo sp.]